MGSFDTLAQENYDKRVEQDNAAMKAFHEKLGGAAVAGPGLDLGADYDALTAASDQVERLRAELATLGSDLSLAHLQGISPEPAEDTIAYREAVRRLEEARRHRDTVFAMRTANQAGIDLHTTGK